MIRQRVYTSSHDSMRAPRSAPFGVPPRPKTEGAPAEGGEVKKTPGPKTPPKKSSKPKSELAPAEGGESAETKAKATA
eukprot:85588-Alexandrium_andersonii.AAC.1